MSLVLTAHGQLLFGMSYSRFRPRFADFAIDRDGENTWVIGCPGRSIKYPVARFTGTYIEASKAIKLQMLTSRMLQ